MHRALLVVALGVLLVVPAPSVGWALVPLAIAGAAAVGVEAAATSVLQETDVRRGPGDRARHQRHVIVAARWSAR